ncbi:MAG: GAF domain-containing protein [Parcubacteria group bacterium]|nr:GAF domain-containing protein [Parcubacteria group bacterium]
MRYTQQDLKRLFEGNTRSLVDDLSSNAVLCSFRFLDVTGKFLISAARFSADPSPDVPEMEETIPVSHTVGGDAVLTGKIQEVRDLAKDDRFSNQKILDAGFTSMMAVPSVFNGEAKGVAQIYSKIKGYTFSKKEKQMAITIANNMAAVIVMKEYAEEVERLQRKAIEAERYRLISEHAGIVTHAVRNKTSGIGGHAIRAQKLLGNVDTSTFDSIMKEQFKKIEVCVERIIKGYEEMEKELEDILNVGQRPPKLEAVNISSLLSVAINEFPKKKGGKNVRCTRMFQTDPNLLVMIDEKQIGNVMNELLQNATDATQNNGEIIVRTRIYDRKGYYSFCVEVENGGEIPPENLKQVFDPFFTTKIRGSGLGLPGLKMIVEKHGGTAVVKSGKGKTIVRVYLPMPRQC